MGLYHCPECGTELDEDCFEWSEGITEAGTDRFHVYIRCPCGWENGAGDWGVVCDEEDKQEFVDRRFPELIRRNET